MFDPIWPPICIVYPRPANIWVALPVAVSTWLPEAQSSDWTIFIAHERDTLYPTYNAFNCTHSNAWPRIAVCMSGWCVSIMIWSLPGRSRTCNCPQPRYQQCSLIVQIWRHLAGHILGNCLQRWSYGGIWRRPRCLWSTVETPSAAASIFVPVQLLPPDIISLP